MRIEGYKPSKGRIRSKNAPYKKNYLTIYATVRVREQIDALASEWGVSRGKVLGRLLNSYYERKELNDRIDSRI